MANSEQRNTLYNKIDGRAKTKPLAEDNKGINVAALKGILEEDEHQIARKDHEEIRKGDDTAEELHPFDLSSL